jgi:hypothetical protein
MSTKDSPASRRERRITAGEIVSAADEHQQVAVPTPWRRRARTADGGRARGERCRRLAYRGGLGTSLQSPIHDCERRRSGARHFPFAFHSTSRASRSALSRSRLAENAFCAISCSVTAFSASTWRNALRASRTALVIGLNGSTSPGVFVIASPWRVFLWSLPRVATRRWRGSRSGILWHV